MSARQMIPAAELLEFVAREMRDRECTPGVIHEVIGEATGRLPETVARGLSRIASTGRVSAAEADAIVVALGGAPSDLPSLIPAPPSTTPVTLVEGRCPTCREVVGVLPDGRCVWCDTQTGAVLPASPPAAPGGPRPPLRSGEVGYGLVCPHCEGPKSEAAYMCRTCRRARGQRTPDRELGVTTHRAILIEEDVLEDARRIYATGLGLRRVAREILPRTGYASEHSCAVSLHAQFTRRGWPLRDRLSASRDASTTHGMLAGGDNAARAAYKRHRNARHPRCVATTTRGTPCSKAALPGRAHCHAHDPVAGAAQCERLAAARARLSDLDQCAGTVEHHDRAGERCQHRVPAGETHCWRHTHQIHQEAA